GPNDLPINSVTVVTSASHATGSRRGLSSFRSRRDTATGSIQDATKNGRKGHRAALCHRPVVKDQPPVSPALGRSSHVSIRSKKTDREPRLLSRSRRSLPGAPLGRPC